MSWDWVAFNRIVGQGYPREIQTTQAVAAMGCPLPNDSGAPLLRTAPTQLIEHEVKLIPTLGLLHYILVSSVWESTLQATKEK